MLVIKLNKISLNLMKARQVFQGIYTIINDYVSELCSHYLWSPMQAKFKNQLRRAHSPIIVFTRFYNTVLIKILCSFVEFYMY